MEKKKYEQPEFPFKHRVALQLRFNDIDALGHVNNSIYFEFFDLGKTNYFETVRGADIDWRGADIGVARTTCDFLSPIYSHEPIAVETQVERFGNKSFVMAQQILNTSTGEVKCACRTVMVGFDVEKGVSAPINPLWKTKICDYEGRDMCNDK